MTPDQGHIQIMRDIASFTKIERYRGMMPDKLALYYDPGRISELLDQGYVERISVSFSCGSEQDLFKLTKEGKDFLDSLSQAPPPAQDTPEEPEITVEDMDEEEITLLNDMYHFSKIRKYNGIMPTSEMDSYDKTRINRLFARGYIMRVKAVSGSEQRQGYILSDRGLRILQYL